MDTSRVRYFWARTGTPWSAALSNIHGHTKKCWYWLAKEVVRMFVSWNLYVEILTPKDNGIIGGGAFGRCLDHEDENFMIRISVIKERPHGGHSVRAQWEDANHEPGRRPSPELDLTRNWSPWSPWSWTSQPLELWDNFLLFIRSQSMGFYYSSPNGFYKRKPYVQFRRLKA